MLVIEHLYANRGRIIMATSQEIQERREFAKQERNRKKKGDLVLRGIKYSYAAPIIKLEKRLFGWHYEGKEKETIDDGYEATVHESGRVSVRHKIRIIKYAWFSRPKVWPKNILFVLTEILSGIVSFFRRLLISFVPLVAILLIILAATGNGPEFVKIVLIVYASLIGGSIVLALFGLLWKKVFKLEDKCDQILLDNGFATWSENEEGEHL